MKKETLSLVGLVVVIFVMLFVILIVMPVLNKLKKIGSKPICGTNLKGMGNAVTVYANDFDGQYPCQGKGFDHTWGDVTDDWMNPDKDWSQEGGITVGASLYLLVRLADVSPRSFVCPPSDQWEFSGRNPQNLDIVELWDFGDFREGKGPARCVSYSYHQPYDPAGPKTGKAGRFRADDTRSAAFAVMADRNPWYDPKLPKAGMEFDLKYFRHWASPILDHWNKPPTDTRAGSERQRIMVANAQPHEREGQNVMYADGHAGFERMSDVGVKNDNIYTRTDPENLRPIGWRRGIWTERPDRRGEDETPATKEDSFLVNDFVEKVR
jgi:hypothetical protein